MSSKNLLFRNSIIATPIYLMTIIPFIVIGNYLDLNINAGYIALGALGWWIALLLRLPFVLAVQKFIKNQDTATRFTVGLSGPAEEVVRLIILATIGLTSGNAYSVGLGWAFIEIIYGLVQLFGIASLKDKKDKKSLEAKEMIKKMGMDKTFDNDTPFWGALERVSATSIHISFGLMLVINPYFVLATIPLHSSINFIVLYLNKISIAKSQIAFFMLSIVLFAILIIGI